MIATPGRLRNILEAAINQLDVDALGELDSALPVMHLQLLELAVSARHAPLARADADALDCRATRSVGIRTRLNTQAPRPLLGCFYPDAEWKSS
jgi:hypothetical protein